MKLPEDSAERNKILLLAGIGVAALVYVAWAFLLQPALATRQEQAKEIELKKDDIHKNSLMLRQVGRLEREYAASTSNLYAFSADYILKPTLGNYLLSIRDAVDSVTDPLELQGVQISSGSRQGIPVPANRSKPFQLTSYGVNLSLECDYNKLKEFLRAVQEAFPMVVVSQLQIATHPTRVDVHRVQVELQWPIWTQPEYHETLQSNYLEQVAAAAENGP